MLNVFEELGETSRRQILAELSSGPKNVSELVDSTGLKQPNVSNHLARMRAKGIVKHQKVGRQVYYSLASEEVVSALAGVFSEREGDDEPIDFELYARQYAKCAVQGDERTCTDIVERALRVHVPVLELYQELLTPAMALVGTWYKVAAIDEAQEHLASSITERMMSRVMHANQPGPSHGRVAVLGCAPGAWHVIGLRMVSDFLRTNGWKTLFLGANVPIESYVAAVAQHKPDLVLASCCAEESIEPTRELVSRLAGMRARRATFSIAVGGLAVSEDPARFPGADFTPRDLREFSEILPELERTRG